MLKRAAQSLFLVGMLLSTSLLWAADEAGLVYGAGTLGHKKMAVSLDLGWLKPLALYDLRFDVGLGERFQFGLGGSYLQGSGDKTALVSLFNKMTFFRSENQKHFLSAQLDGHYSYNSYEISGDSHQAFFLNPVFLYEFRFATKNPTGVYTGVGVLSTILGDDESNADDLFTFSTRKNTHVFDFLAGVQHRFGRHFSAGLEGDFLYRLNNRFEFDNSDPFWGWIGGLVKTDYGFSAKLGLHWAF